MIHILETWHFKPEFADRLPEVMQKLDDLVGPAAHAHPAFSGHATFLNNPQDASTDVMVLYGWRSREDADDLIASEKAVIRDFTSEYCTAERSVVYLDEVPHTHGVDDNEHG